MRMLQSKHTDEFVKENINNSDNLVEWERKLYEVTKKVEVKEVESEDNTEEAGVMQNFGDKRTKKSKKSDGIVEDTSASKTKSEKMRMKRNYWVEYWDDNTGHWICMLFFMRFCVCK